MGVFFFFGFSLFLFVWLSLVLAEQRILLFIFMCNCHGRLLFCSRLCRCVVYVVCVMAVYCPTLHIIMFYEHRRGIGMNDMRLKISNFFICSGRSLLYVTFSLKVAVWQ